MQPTMPTVRTSIVLGVKKYAAERNIPVDDILTRLGIRLTPQHNPLEEIPFEKVIRLFELVSERTADRCFGLHLALSFPPGGTVPLGNMALSAASVRSAIEAVAKHIRGYMGDIDVDFRVENGRGRLSWRLPQFNIAPVQYNLFGAALTVARIRVAAGQTWCPECVELDCEEVPCRAEMAQVFGPNVTFGRPRNVLVVGKATLDLAMPTADPGLHAELVRVAEQRSSLKSEGNVVERVQAVVGDRLSKSQASLDKVSAALGVTPRSLQWQLEQRGTTFERIVNDTRRARAERLLAQTDQALIDIAFELGFSDPSAFTRAGRRWFGVSPKEYRRQHRGAPKPPSR